MVGEVFCAESQRVHVDGVREFVHVAFAGEMVGGSSQSPIGALAQRILGWMKLDALVGNVVRSSYRGRPGVVVVKFPGDERSVVAHSAFDVDYACRAEVCPGKFLLAGPHDFDGLAGCFG